MLYAKHSTSLEAPAVNETYKIAAFMGETENICNIYTNRVI